MRGIPRSSANVLPRPRGDVYFRRADPVGVLVSVLAYWQHRRGQRCYPRRADIDPVDIPDLLPFVVLLDVVGEPHRFRKRLVGSAIVQKEGCDTTGRWLDDTVNPMIRDEVLRQHEEACDSLEGSCYLVEFNGEDGKLYSYQRLLLPLSNDGRQVDMLFGGAHFLPPVNPARRRIAQQARRGGPASGARQ